MQDNDYSDFLKLVPASLKTRTEAYLVNYRKFFESLGASFEKRFDKWCIVFPLEGGENRMVFARKYLDYTLVHILLKNQIVEAFEDNDFRDVRLSISLNYTDTLEQDLAKAEAELAFVLTKVDKILSDLNLLKAASNEEEQKGAWENLIDTRIFKEVAIDVPVASSSPLDLDLTILLKFNEAAVSHINAAMYLRDTLIEKLTAKLVHMPEFHSKIDGTNPDYNGRISKTLTILTSPTVRPNSNDGFEGIYDFITVGTTFGWYEKALKITFEFSSVFSHASFETTGELQINYERLHACLTEALKETQAEYLTRDVSKTKTYADLVSATHEPYDGLGL